MKKINENRKKNKPENPPYTHTALCINIDRKILDFSGFKKSFFA